MTSEGPSRGLGISLAVLVVAAASLACREQPTPRTSADAAPPETGVVVSPPESLRVMTLNLGHGRGDQGHQIFQGRKTIEAHLDRVAELIGEVDPDVVALQEADGPSGWSGGFGHVEYVAQRTGLPHVFAGIHARSPIFEYGTALLSRLPLVDPRSVAFAPTFPTFTKGYVAAEIVWPVPGTAGRRLTVVSVHLDFSRQTVRKEQALRLVEDLAGQDEPLVLMGDLNTDPEERGSVLLDLVEELDLHTFDPEGGTVTYPRLDRRLDWILLSGELRFESHRIVEELVSDHRAVWADVSWR